MVGRKEDTFSFSSYVLSSFIPSDHAMVAVTYYGAVVIDAPL